MLQDRLLNTAIDRFGRLGFDGASTRDIARASDTAMSSITYHFGGKEGLYLACADHIACQIRSRQTATLALADDAEKLSPNEALERILQAMDSVAMMMLHDDSAAWSRFVVREQLEPTEAFERLYRGVMQDLLNGFEALLRRIRPKLERKQLRALGLMIFGQALVMRAARATVCKALEVGELGPDEGNMLRGQLRRNIIAILTGGTE
ncbi:hypothetical protein SZ64_14910 [Erythrobacter sp. SG61-1L]|uniref:CerR family C-terminal domain-containing protein n=1 Tax=Erythrobacter sp. SG61-1L TaxID=1603897 RepID=UPI0006D6EACA|nr:CerR family C-terminal domain-containing protein [Erythrobacter sp. SG61-1L]KPL69281.1 hypothetical protein SZ64_14910 [Erythrobacter sp. SG61-1L]